MSSKVIKISGIMLILAFSAWIIIGCSEDEADPDPVPDTTASCEGCHTNYAHLQEVYTPDTAAPPGGCGGTAPHYEPYDRVYMDGDGYDSYKNSGHYGIGCVGCHNGVDNTSEKETAHSGDFIRHPSDYADEKCGSCHQAIVDNHQTSLHHGTGQKRAVTRRSGLNGPQYFDQLPEHQIEGYNANCATCHTVNGGSALGPDMNIVSYTRTKENIETYSKNPYSVYKRFGYSANAMPTLPLEDQEFKDVADYIDSLQPFKKWMKKKKI